MPDIISSHSAGHQVLTFRLGAAAPSILCGCWCVCRSCSLAENATALVSGQGREAICCLEAPSSTSTLGDAMTASSLPLGDQTALYPGSLHAFVDEK